MKLKFEPNKISFDETGFRNELMGYIRNGMDSFEKRYLDIMGDKIRKFPHTKEYFRSVVAASLEHIREEMVGGVLTYIAGFNEGTADPYDLMKAYVIARGMGSKGVNKTPVHAGPPGRLVYDSYLDSYGPSNQEDHDLPETWNHPGFDFVAETNNDPLVQTEFRKTLEQICRDLPVNIVSKYIKVG